MSKIYNITHLQELEASARVIGKNFSNKEIVLLEGPLGVGKSSWIRCYLKSVGCTEVIPSPSYTLHQVYSIFNKTVHHFDFYRIQSPEELETIGFFDLLLEEKPRLIFIEWANLIERQKWQSFPLTCLQFYWDKNQRYLKCQHYPINENNSHL